MTVRPLSRSDTPTLIASIISRVVVGLLIAWIALAGLLTPVFAAAGP